MHLSEKTTSSHTCCPCNFLCQKLSCHYTAPIHSALCLCKQKQGHCARTHMCPALRWAWFAPTSKVVMGTPLPSPGLGQDASAPSSKVGKGTSAPSSKVGKGTSAPSSKMVRLQPGAWGLLVAALDMPPPNSAVHNESTYRAATVHNSAIHSKSTHST